MVKVMIGTIIGAFFGIIGILIIIGIVLATFTDILISFGDWFERKYPDKKESEWDKAKRLFKK